MFYVKANDSKMTSLKKKFFPRARSGKRIFPGFRFLVPFEKGALCVVYAFNSIFGLFSVLLLLLCRKSLEKI
jgi:hypothetical protein